MLRRLSFLLSFFLNPLGIPLNRNRLGSLIPMGRLSPNSLNSSCLFLRLLGFGNNINVPILSRFMMMPFRRFLSLTGPMMGYMPMMISALNSMPRNMPRSRMPFMRLLRLPPTLMLRGSCSPISSGVS